MPTDEELEAVQGSPQWWRKRLARRMDARRPDLETFDDYYRGKHRLAFATPEFRRYFANLFQRFRDNWCDLVVDAVEERLTVQGFRMAVDEAADDDAWKMWQRNQLDAESGIAHTEALINGEVYGLVWWGDDGEPEVTIEHPRQMIVAYQSGYRGNRQAALKRWVDDSGLMFATVYLPDGLYKFQSTEKVRDDDLNQTAQPSSVRWTQRQVDGEEWPLPNRLRVVPVVPLCNRPRLLTRAESEIDKVIPVQDAINKTVVDALVASEFAGFPQRWATGIELPQDPETGEPMDEEKFKHSIARLWNVESEVAKFGEFQVAELGNYVKLIEMLVQHVASQTRTPPHYFYLSGQFPSGESIKSAETGLVAKARRKMRHFGEAWEEIIRLMFLVKGDTARASLRTSETIWGDPESRSESEHTDAAVKKQALGIPDEALWEDLGYSPQQIERFKRQRAEESLMPATALVAPQGLNGQQPATAQSFPAVRGQPPA